MTVLPLRCLLLAAAVLAGAGEPLGIDRFDPRLDDVLAADAPITELSSGHQWSEGPVWSARLGGVLFSDVPRNRILLWTATGGTRVWMERSGGVADQQGSNGLAFDREGRLVLCQHGARRVLRLEALAPDSATTVLAVGAPGRAFNSPNDLHLAGDGSCWFTDPPYGLPAGTAPELALHGVWRVRAGTTAAELMIGELRYPNGIAMAPDERTLYVAISDRDHPRIMAYPLSATGAPGPGRILLDARPLRAAGRPGSCDGLKVDRHGVLVATGPGGVLVIAPDGTLLGLIRTGSATANVAFGEADGGTLFITAKDRLLRVRTRTAAARWSAHAH